MEKYFPEKVRVTAIAASRGKLIVVVFLFIIIYELLNVSFSISHNI